MRTPRTFGSLVDILGARIRPTRIVTGGTGILPVVGGLKPLEALHPGVVDILGKADKSRRRRRSIGSRHFKWRTG